MSSETMVNDEQQNMFKRSQKLYTHSKRLLKAVLFQWCMPNSHNATETQADGKLI